MRHEEFLSNSFMEKQISNKSYKLFSIFYVQLLTSKPESV